MKVSAAIVGWDDTDMLAGCLESVREFAWPVAYADGPWELACDHRPWELACDQKHPPLMSLPKLVVAGLLSGSSDLLLDYPGRPWASEAAKRTALAQLCESVMAPPEWLLWLDTDERLEAPDVCAAKDWLVANLNDDHLWATLIIHRPDQGWSDGFPIPRLIRNTQVCFLPPRDFEAWIHIPPSKYGAARIAYMDGEKVPDDMTGRYLHVPREVMCIRHDKAERPIAQKERTSRYVRRRLEAHGV